MVFTVERTIESSKVTHAGYEETLRIVQDPVAMIRLNSLVIDVRAGSDTDVYIIKDNLSICGFRMIQEYIAKAEKLPDGILFHVKAGPVTSVNRWKVSRVPGTDGEIEIKEEARVKCLFFLMPYVASTINQSHKHLLESLVAKVEEGKAGR